MTEIALRGLNPGTVEGWVGAVGLLACLHQRDPEAQLDLTGEVPRLRSELAQPARLAARLRETQGGGLTHRPLPEFSRQDLADWVEGKPNSGLTRATWEALLGLAPELLLQRRGVQPAEVWIPKVTGRVSAGRLAKHLQGWATGRAPWDRVGHGPRRGWWRQAWAGSRLKPLADWGGPPAPPNALTEALGPWLRALRATDHQLQAPVLPLLAATEDALLAWRQMPTPEPAEQLLVQVARLGQALQGAAEPLPPLPSLPPCFGALLADRPLYRAAWGLAERRRGPPPLPLDPILLESTTRLTEVTDLAWGLDLLAQLPEPPAPPPPGHSPAERLLLAARGPDRAALRQLAQEDRWSDALEFAERALAAGQPRRLALTPRAPWQPERALAVRLKKVLALSDS